MVSLSVKQIDIIISKQTSFVEVICFHFYVTSFTWTPTGKARQLHGQNICQVFYWVMNFRFDCSKNNNSWIVERNTTNDWEKCMNLIFVTLNLVHCSFIEQVIVVFHRSDQVTTFDIINYIAFILMWFNKTFAIVPRLIE